jgi:hypothetical protein
MSIGSAIARSKDDLKPYSNTSISTLNLNYEILDLKGFLKDWKGNDVKERIHRREYSVDKSKQVFRFYDPTGRSVTTNQIREFFDDIGFNVDVLMSEGFSSDVIMVYNIGGYLLLGWRWFSRLITRYKPEWKLLMSFKLSPGVKRLHCRLYEYHDGSWLMTSHVDHANWMNVLNPFEMVRSHFVKGTGDYDLGTEIMKRALGKIIPLLKDRERFDLDLNEIYKNIIVEKDRDRNH